MCTEAPSHDKQVDKLWVQLTAIGAETTGDALAPVGDLGDLLGRSLQHFEVGARHHNVVAVVAARDLAAVGAVAEGLYGSCQFRNAIVGI